MKAEQQASNRAAFPEPEEVEPQKPERGLTFKLRGAARLHRAASLGAQG